MPGGRGGSWTSPTASCAILVSCVLAGPAGASAQSPDTAADLSPPKRIVVSFQQRSRVEKQTHPFRLDALGATRVLAFRTRLQVDVREVVGPIGAFLELQDSRSGGNDQPFVAPARHVNHLDFLQAQLRLGSDQLLDRQASAGVTLGRFTLDLGRRRFVARNGMRNTTNAFDGGMGWIATRSGLGLRVLVSRPVRIEPEALDSARPRRGLVVEQRLEVFERLGVLHSGTATFRWRRGVGRTRRRRGAQELG